MLIIAGALVNIKPVHQDASVQCELLQRPSKTFIDASTQCDMWSPRLTSSPIKHTLCTSESESSDIAGDVDTSTGTYHPSQ